MTDSNEQIRANSDLGLLEGGAIKSDGSLLITDEQYLKLHEEMKAELSKRVEETKKTIETMPIDKFGSLQKELQYALKWWSEAFSRSQTHILANSGEQQDAKAHNYYSHGLERTDVIAKSPLYDAVRARLRKEYDAPNLPDDWCGWVGLQQEDVKNINGAIEVFLRKELPTRGMIGTGTTEDQLFAAKDTIKRYGIQGIFIDNPTEAGLDTVFQQNYGR